MFLTKLKLNCSEVISNYYFFFEKGLELKIDILTHKAFC